MEQEPYGEKIISTMVHATRGMECGSLSITGDGQAKELSGPAFAFIFIFSVIVFVDSLYESMNNNKQEMEGVTWVKKCCASSSMELIRTAG